MKELKLLQKTHFLSYAPYGLCSRQATAITGRKNRYCTQVLLGKDKDKIIEQCRTFKKRVTERAKYACKQGLVRDAALLCGHPTSVHSFRILTKEGLQAITEATDEAIDEFEDAEHLDEEKEYDGNIKETNSGKVSRQTESLRDELYAYANSPDPEDQATFQELLLDAVITGQATPLTAGLPYIQNIKITTKKYSPFQLYNIWRYSHVNAMFQANKHLTWLDRRPYDTHFAIDGIHDEESYRAYIEKHGCTMAAFTYRALTDWYSNNPDYYRITQQYPDDSEEAYNTWLNTPAFYNARELPTLGEREKGVYEDSPTGSQKNLTQ